MSDGISKIIDPSFCGWDSTQYLIFSDNVFGNFIYYSHLFPSISILILAILVFFNNPHGLPNRILLFIAVVFVIWSLFDLVLWATERTDYTMFFWSSLIYFDFLLYVGAWYFMYTLIHRRMPHWIYDLIFFILLVPLLLFAHTNLNLVAFDYTNCFREALEGPLWQYYVYSVEILIAIWVILQSVFTNMKIKNPSLVKQNFLALTGIVIFLLMFSAGNILGSLEIDWELGQYGLFGMPLMACFLVYIIVRYESFKVRLLAPEALVGVMVVLNLSLLLVTRIQNVRIIASVTTIIVLVMGFLLVRSVRKETKQRHQIEKLAVSLEHANNRLKELDKLKSEFVSIASHQLRSPLTSMRGYAAMLADGSYGLIPDKAKEAVGRIADSSAFMAKMVENYLNVSRIESGNMKYELSDFNLKLEVEKIIDDKRQEVMKKGLLLTFKSQLTGQGIVHSDIGKTLEIIHNLLNNAVKYTPSGSIAVLVRDEVKKKKIYVDITDSGIGMTEEDVSKLFGKFSRATNANNVNINGTGLGLYVARTMALAMRGDITAHSEGQGKGSTFTLILPEVM